MKHGTTTTRVELRRQSRARGRLGAVAAFLWGAMPAIGAVILIWQLDAMRRIEAALSAWVIAHALDTGTFHEPETTQIVVGLGGNYAFTLELDLACSVVLLVLPLLVLASALLISRRALPIRVFAVLALGIALLVAVNQARMIVIAHSTLVGGMSGFGWSHNLYGAAIALVGLLLVIVAFVFLSGAGSRRAHFMRGRRPA